MVKKTKKSKRVKLSDPQRAPTNNILAPNWRAPNDRPVETDGRYPTAKSPFPSAAGVSESTVAGLSVSPSSVPKSFDAGPPTQTAAIGNTGTQIFGGYFQEDYLGELRGRRAAKEWDRIRRSEAQVAMLMNAISNPIKSANWDIEPYKEADADFEKHVAFCKHNIFERIDFNTFKHEALTFMPFGFSLFEIVHDVVHNHPDFGTYNGLKTLAFRSQKTIENWQLEPKTGRIIGINQYTYSDLGGNQFIPGEFLLVFTNSKEGDNYEGISVLRPIYGAFKRKDLYLKLAAIGIERYAIGTPIGTVPKGKERSKEFDEFSKLLQNYTSHETSYIVKPEGWEIEIQQGNFDASKVKEMLIFENTEMVNSLVANFLVLGMNGSGGAYALGSNLGEFFTSGIQSYADLICDVINRHLIPNLIKLNFGEQPGYPKLKCTGISDKAGKELAETVKFLTDARALDPDQPLKDFLRKQYKLPKSDPSTATALPLVPAGAAANFPKPGSDVIDPASGKPMRAPEQDTSEPVFNPSTGQKLNETAPTIKLADKKYVAQFDRNKADLKMLMQSNLKANYDKLKAQLRKRFNSLSGSDKILAAKGQELPGLVAYKAALRERLAEAAKQARAQANAKLPKSKRVKLGDAYDSLSPAVRKLIDIQSTLVAETQAADIEKMVFFSFTSEATVTDDIDAILHAVDDKALASLDGSTAEGMSIDVAAADALAHVVSQSALDLFFEPDVLDGIESFTFTNEDPVSDICQELAGTTFAVGDPDLDKYTPPMHHNCKSRLVPNMKGDDGNPEIDRDGVSLSKQALASITLSEKK